MSRLIPLPQSSSTIVVENEVYRHENLAVSPGNAPSATKDCAAAEGLKKKAAHEENIFENSNTGNVNKEFYSSISSGTSLGKEISRQRSARIMCSQDPMVSDAGPGFRKTNITHQSIFANYRRVYAIDPPIVASSSSPVEGVSPIGRL